MRRTYERGARARLSFSVGPHAPVNMADSMENAGSWTVSGSKEAMEVPKNFTKTWRTKYSAVQCSKGAISCGGFPPTFTSSILSAMFTGACGPPEKLSLALVPRSYVLRMIMKVAYGKTLTKCLSFMADLIEKTVAMTTRTNTRANENTAGADQGPDPGHVIGAGDLGHVKGARGHVNVTAGDNPAPVVETARHQAFLSLCFFFCYSLRGGWGPGRVTSLQLGS